MTNDHYILKGRRVFKVSAMEWARWFETAKRTVKKTTLKNGLLVSTVFLGLDHNFNDKGAPLIFESMVFDTKKKEKIKFPGFPNIKTRYTIGEELDCVRYSTYAQAEAGHRKLIRKYAKAVR